MAANLWLFYALAASVLWGLYYLLSEKIMGQGIHPAFLMLCQNAVTLPLYVLACMAGGHMRPGVAALTADGFRMPLLLLFYALVILCANLFVLSGIAARNATLVNLIEISYPLFTCLFAWLLFRDVQITAGAAAGAVLIVAGIAVIYLKG